MTTRQLCTWPDCIVWDLMSNWLPKFGSEVANGICRIIYFVGVYDFCKLTMTTFVWNNFTYVNWAFGYSSHASQCESQGSESNISIKKIVLIKVWVFWGGHKIWKNLRCTFDKCAQPRCTILLHLVLITLLVRWGQI